MDERLKKYPGTDRFKVIDTIWSPHPYCITPAHVVRAADHFCGRLSEDAIRDAEKHGARCDICAGIVRKRGGNVLTYDEHKVGLLIEVDDSGLELKDVPGLKEFLDSIEDMRIKDGFAGCAFVRRG